jgi:hypothetical protein
MASRKKPKPKKAKLTDADRHARFVNTVRKIGASEDPEEFEKAFERVTSRPSDRRSRRNDPPASS